MMSVAYADEVNDSRNFDYSNFSDAQQLITLLEQPEEIIDFAVAKLEIDKLVEPSIDIKANLHRIEAIVKNIQSMLPSNASSGHKLLALKKYLYEPGIWNNYLPYQYDFEDPKGTKIVNKLLSTYVKSKKGNCVSMPFLFIILGQRLGIDVTVSTAPLHFLVK